MSITNQGPSRLALGVVWAAFLVAALLLLAAGNPLIYGIGIPVAALALAAVCARVGLFDGAVKWFDRKVDARDLLAVGVMYVVVVGLLKLAFAGFGTGQMLWFFLTYALAMLLGVAGPIVYVVWVRGRTLRAIGLGLHNLGWTAVLALVLAATQFTVTLWGYSLPAPVDWIPLLLMSITVGAFEAVFFRGFVVGTLEPSLGAVPAVAIAAALYAVYHFGYGMGPSTMLFLFGLGVVYTIGFRVTGNVLAIWPLLTPLGGFFNQLKGGEMSGQLPWASMIGFGEVLVVMAIVVALAARHQRRAAKTSARRLQPVVGG